MLRRWSEAEEYVTKDGSKVRELIHPLHTGESRLSVAIARLEEGCAARKHLHRESEEVYYIISGSGVVHVGGESSQVEAGDAVLIPANTPHFAVNTGRGELVILCASSPPYSHEDTVLL
ncbi:MAG: cupin domain-containing protein [Euryarchaeota archaeon]|nr:cupin domain-containing protein [Euryarchaeota archaeon]